MAVPFVSSAAATRAPAPIESFTEGADARVRRKSA